MSRRITLAEGEAPPTEFLIFARGKNQTTKGVFLYDAAAARSVMGAAEEWAGDLGNKYTLDYEHDQTRDDLPGYEKLDAGSFDLEDRPEGLFAVNVRWTDRAAGMITKREKRFTSPWFIFEKATGRVLRIVNVALCSIPATKQLQPLVAASATLAQETLMTDWMADLSKPEMLRMALGYCADTLRMAQCLAPHFGEGAKASLDGLRAAAASVGMQCFAELAEGNEDMQKMSVGLAADDGEGLLARWAEQQGTPAGVLATARELAKADTLAALGPALMAVLDRKDAALAQAEARAKVDTERQSLLASLPPAKREQAVRLGWSGAQIKGYLAQVGPQVPGAVQIGQPEPVPGQTLHQQARPAQTGGDLPDGMSEADFLAYAESIGRTTPESVKELREVMRLNAQGITGPRVAAALALKEAR